MKVIFSMSVTISIFPNNFTSIVPRPTDFTLKKWSLYTDLSTTRLVKEINRFLPFFGGG